MKTNIYSIWLKMVKFLQVGIWLVIFNIFFIKQQIIMKLTKIVLKIKKKMYYLKITFFRCQYKVCIIFRKIIPNGVNWHPNNYNLKNSFPILGICKLLCYALL